MINLGNKIIQDLKLGDKRVHRVYLGGPDNLLLNSDFKNGTTGWTLDTNVTLDNAKILAGRYSIKSNQSGLSSNSYRGCKQNINLSAGDKITLSGYALTDNVAALSADVIPAYLEVIYFNASGSRITQHYVNVVLPSANEWKFFHNSFTAPVGTTYATVVAMVTKNGCVWFNGLKAEMGINTTPQWTPSASEATEDSCMIWKEEQPYNLLLNSDFKNGTTGWTLDAGVSLDVTKTINGRYSVKSNQSGHTADTWAGANGRNIPSKEGDILTSSMYTLVEDLSTFDSEKGYTVGIHWFNSSNVRVGYDVKTVTKSEIIQGKWQHIVVKSKAPAGTSYGRLAMHPVRNGCIWFNSPKLEVGSNDYPEWTPAASETENILLNSGVKKTNSLYNIATYRLAETPTIGDTYTVTIWGDIGTKTSFMAYNSGDMVELAWPNKIADGVYSASFQWREVSAGGGTVVAANTALSIFAWPNNGTTATINKIKLEKGRNPNPVWSPNIKDITDALVCYYNPKLQGCTNKNMRSNNLQLKDLSGNGVNLYCQGFSWNTNNGIASDGSLIFDGQNSFCTADNKPILTDYTLIANRAYTELQTRSCLASSSKVQETGAFICEIVESNNLYFYSYGSHITLQSSLLSPKVGSYEVIVQSKTKYNEENLNVGTASDTSGLYLGTVRPLDTRLFKGKLQSFILFNRTLTDAEIEWMKNNSTVELRNIKNLTAPESIPNFYPYSADIDKWKNWLTYDTYWACGNSDELQDGDWISVNGIISDMDNIPIQFIAKVIGRQTASNGLKQLQVSKETAYLIY